MTLERSAWLGLFLLATGCAEPLAASQEGEATEKALGTLRFAADGSHRLDGVLLEGKGVKVAYDVSRLTQCEGYQGGTPRWSITGFAQLGHGTPQTFPVLDPNHPEGYEHVLTIGAAGPLQLWFQSTNVWGCLAWDSNEGQNYRFEVKPATKFPTWAGDERMVFSRCEASKPCVDEELGLSDGFVFDTEARQRAKHHHVHFEAWEPGISDWDNPDLGYALEARIHLRYDWYKKFESRPVELVGRDGNNAHYVVNLRHLDPFGGTHIHLAENCPEVPFFETPEGSRVAAEVEYYFTINGVELRPAGGGAYQGRFEDYVGLYDLCVE
jgi:hypothetical protein